MQIKLKRLMCKDTVVWNNDSFIFLITTEIKEFKNEDVLKMAESVKSINYLLTTPVMVE